MRRRRPGASPGSSNGAGSGRHDSSQQPVAVVKSDWQLYLAQWDASFWMPSWNVALYGLLCLRALAAAMTNVSDCDESFNFWEPTHFLTYGRGFQTWEYSPEFGLRSYVYVGLHALASWAVGAAWGADKIQVFYRTRVVLGLVCALCEAWFVSAIGRRFGHIVGSATLCFLLTSAGMFHASVAFLPSSFAMYCVLAGVAAWCDRRRGLAMACGALASVIGWPFAGVIWVPLAAVSLLSGRRAVTSTVVGGALATVFLTVVSYLVDTWFYGTPVVAFWNIIKYNVLGQGSGGQGSELYGVEPWTFYPLNLALNLNVVAVLAYASVLLPLSWGVRHVMARATACGDPPRFRRDVLAVLGGMWVWYAIMGTRPHKEERFMFVVYPLACFAGGVMVREARLLLLSLQRCAAGARLPSASSWSFGDTLAYGAVLLSLALSASRMGALMRGYGAPLRAYQALTDHLQADGMAPFSAAGPSVAPSARVCVGKEWYRFPSSHFLPDHVTAGGGPLELAFLKSDFGGQLPQPFVAKADGGSAVIQPGFNDANIEEPDRYVDVDTCDYVVDFRLPPPHPNAEPYFQDAHQWRVVWSAPFLHAPSSPRASRTFFVPAWSTARNVYGTYEVLQRVEPHHDGGGGV